jgi:hypothetical protein
MKKLFLFFLVIILFISCGKAVDTQGRQKTDSDNSAEIQYKKELDEIRKSMKGEVKIKLKKDGKGAYSWEISGKDAQEVLKTNDALKKRLSD